MGIVVERLTPALVAALKADAAVALNGDGRCSLKTMSMSCFASETCARGQPFSSMQLDMLLRHTYSFVTLDAQSRSFVGCVSAEKAALDTTVRHYLPHISIPSDAVILYNLCVSEAHRGRGAGRLLVEAIEALVPSRDKVFLLISKLNPAELNPERRTVYEERVARLAATYTKLGYERCAECPHCRLMRRRGTIRVPPERPM